MALGEFMEWLSAYKRQNTALASDLYHMWIDIKPTNDPVQTIMVINQRWFLKVAFHYCLFR
jgi:hypothetical protein